MGAMTDAAMNPISGGVIERRLEAAQQMFDIQTVAAKLTYLSPILAQTSLPHDEPDPALPFFKCENGNVATTIVRGRSAIHTPRASSYRAIPTGRNRA